MKRKGQQVLTVLLLTAVVLTVSLSAYIWGRDMIQRTTERREFDEMENFIRELNENIKEVSRRGGRRELEVELPEGGELVLEDAPATGQDNITLEFEVGGEMMTTGRDIVITGEEGTEASMGEDPETIIARSEEGHDSYHVRFKLYYRNMTSNGDQQRIGIEPSGATAARSGTARVILERGDRVELNGFVVNKVKFRIIQ